MFIAPIASPSSTAEPSWARDQRCTAGRTSAVSSSPEKASRIRVMPFAPASSKAVRATALPNCTDRIETSTSAGAGTRSVGDRCADGVVTATSLGGDARDRLRREEVATWRCVRSAVRCSSTSTTATTCSPRSTS